MDRQTIRYPDGAVELKCSVNDAVMCLAAYEDTGFEPDMLSMILDSVADWYDAYKDNRLIIPPCKVGDTVFEITNLPGDDAIQMRFVAEIAWLSGHGTVLLSSGFVIGFDDFGKTVFRSREEAEAALGGDGDGRVDC